MFSFNIIFAVVDVSFAFFVTKITVLFSTSPNSKRYFMNKEILLTMRARQTNVGTNCINHVLFMRSLSASVINVCGARNVLSNDDGGRKVNTVHTIGQPFWYCLGRAIEQDLGLKAQRGKTNRVSLHFFSV